MPARCGVKIRICVGVPNGALFLGGAVNSDESSASASVDEMHPNWQISEKGSRAKISSRGGVEHLELARHGFHQRCHELALQHESEPASVGIFATDQPRGRIRFEFPFRSLESKQQPRQQQQQRQRRRLGAARAANRPSDRGVSSRKRELLRLAASSERLTRRDTGS